MKIFLIVALVFFLMMVYGIIWRLTGKLWIHLKKYDPAYMAQEQFAKNIDNGLYTGLSFLWPFVIPVLFGWVLIEFLEKKYKIWLETRKARKDIKDNTPIDSAKNSVYRGSYPGPNIMKNG